jgi:exonuclease III
MNENKRDELQLLLREKKVDVLGLTESWTHDGISDAEISFSGYRMFRKDRSNSAKTRGGGVLLYVKEEFTAQDLTRELDSENESLWIKIGTKESESVVIGICYRSPSAEKKESESLYRSIHNYTSNNSTCLILGDFNFSDINWNLMQSGSLGKEFMDLIHDKFLTQHVGQATRGDNILDLVISTEPDMVEDLEVLNPIANSDHCAIYWKLVFKTEIECSNIIEYNCKKGFCIRI